MFLSSNFTMTFPPRVTLLGSIVLECGSLYINRIRYLVGLELDGEFWSLITLLSLSLQGNIACLPSGGRSSKVPSCKQRTALTTAEPDTDLSLGFPAPGTGINKSLFHNLPHLGTLLFQHKEIKTDVNPTVRTWLSRSKTYNNCTHRWAWVLSNLCTDCLL